MIGGKEAVMDKPITKRWINEQGEGHWEVSCGKSTITCDDRELEETIAELMAESTTAA